MDYQLAKALKDAGFPQSDFTGNGPYFPTLEELIEACGEDFSQLIYDWVPPRTVGDMPWYAYRKASKLFPSRGATPTEAVARLWLALNTKGDTEPISNV